MVALVPEVHLFICLDPRVAPGPILHCLDVARAQDWQQETVLVCDEAWRKFVNIDQPVLFIDRKKIFGNSIRETPDSIEFLEQFLEQLDNFEIRRVTQIGELTWGRWLNTYFDVEDSIPQSVINWDQKDLTSLQIVNDVAEELALDMTSTLSEETRSSSVYLDPYEDGSLSPSFLSLIQGLGKNQCPSWLTIVVKDEDYASLVEIGLEENLVEFSEFEMSLFNQPVLCFSDRSIFAQTSRSYHVALFNNTAESSLFSPGDISINPNEEIHISELFNILAYWRSRRLKELAFQWLNMGIEIHCIEIFHSRVVKRNLLNYSSDLFHSQFLVDHFVTKQSTDDNSDIFQMILKMRKEVDNDPYTLSFSLKILLMIVERMMASAQCGERLFQRLGSDYHRVIIGEALIEGLIQNRDQKSQLLDIKKKLAEFHSFLIKVDHLNDQEDIVQRRKESA